VILLSATSWGSATLLELVWTLAGLASFVVSFMNLADAHADLLAARASGKNGVLRAVAWMEVREEGLRVAKSALIALAGAAAMLTPPANPARPITPLAVIVTALVCALAALVAAGAFTAAASRREVLDEIRAKHRPGETG